VNEGERELDRLIASLRARGFEGARIAIVLGSGLGPFAERLARARSVAYEELEGMPRSAVPGHVGRLLIGELAGTRVLVQAGRVHLYEGWREHEVTRAVRAFAAIGCRALVLTNAAGGLRRAWPPGTLMRIRDHVNLQGRTPLAPAEAGCGAPYDAELGAALDRGAADADVALESGVYAGLLGPSYETPAEIRMLAWMGADAVGMSTVAEALAARAAGARVAAISCITNLAAGLNDERLSHAEVVETGRAAAGSFARVLERSIPHLAATLGEG
jgi:purine-nucleoside phosphorylase